MKFYISRTSDWRNENPQYEGCVMLRQQNYMGQPLYGIEISTLEELIELKQKVGHSIIIRNADEDDSYSKYEIEIYDTYRE